ncbi:MAG: Ribulose-phosphate 3-epimerase [Alphaproteobacteria bacterium MarineAlpha2_Bin1]|nr:MAG: Ribulose-phosphate 3-epimerase [Alphaproteobacteria bacterium MarineAlpha2_Bin1]|tara:strand:+ start:69 stop:731 length:663 start_codon:yes stop_codon:yes gene_type:complete
MEKNLLIAPSILSCDFSRLGEEIQDITEAGADLIHIDVMDGHFVPNLTIGPGVIKSIRNDTDLMFDVHLMIENVDKYIPIYSHAGADIITIHSEVSENILRSIKIIKDHGKKAGLAFNPKSSIGILNEVIEKIDLVLIMTVNPGFGGQSFMENQLEKITATKKIIDNSNSEVLLEVDGGINESNIKYVVESGANTIVAGSAIFSGTKNDYKLNIDKLRIY